MGRFARTLATLYAAKRAAPSPDLRPAHDHPPRGRRVLVVDDDPGLRALLQVTFDSAELELDEAESVEEATALIAARPPQIVVLDIDLPGVDGLSFCRTLKDDPATRGLRIVLLSGSDDATPAAMEAAGADALVRKPFSPLELLSLVERLLGEGGEGRSWAAAEADTAEQVILYARDLRRLLEVERGQRLALQSAYRETVTALTSALESKDSGTGAHSQRVQTYALELTAAVAPRLGREQTLEYGYLLHDIGKIGIPATVLRKPGPLSPPERRLMETHTVLGEQMLADISLLQGEGLRVVRSHHERWDGGGYPDRLSGEAIPLGARIFALADTLDAITSDRPYRAASSWEAAVDEITGQAGRQFDPRVVDAFRASEKRLRRVYYELSAA